MPRGKLPKRAKKHAFYFRSDKAHFKVDEINYKENVSNQIDRIAQLFSEKISTNERIDFVTAQKIHVDTIKNAVEALEIMLFPYCEEDEMYQNLKKEAEKLLKKSEKEEDEIKKLRLKLEYARKKWMALMILMDRKRMLLEEAALIDEGFEDEGMISETEIKEEIPEEKIAVIT